MRTRPSRKRSKRSIRLSGLPSPKLTPRRRGVSLRQTEDVLGGALPDPILQVLSDGGLQCPQSEGGALRPRGDRLPAQDVDHVVVVHAQHLAERRMLLVHHLHEDRCRGLADGAALALVFHVAILGPSASDADVDGITSAAAGFLPDHASAGSSASATDGLLNDRRDLDLICRLISSLNLEGDSYALPHSSRSLVVTHVRIANQLR